MLKNIAFAAVLIQVAVFSALITQTVLFASTATQAADVQPAEPLAVTKSECTLATWPDIPEKCLKRIEPRKHFTTLIMSAEQ
ncbi:hypothetical protein ACVDG5_010090 [Mesorhizobium sp. ORM6]